MVLAPLLASLSVLLASASLGMRVDPRVAGMIERLTPKPRERARRQQMLAWLAGRVPFGLGHANPRLVRLAILASVNRPPSELVAMKLASASTGVVPVALLRPGVSLSACLLVGLAVAGYRFPDLLLSRRARSRQSDIERRVPDLVELLVATTEAGLAPAVAVRRSAEVLAGPLGRELQIAVDEIDLGVSWREAMDRLVERTDVPALGRLVAALARSNRLGTSIGSTLRTVADDLRADRRARAEEIARRAPVKMLFPLVFLILPAFLLLTVGPVVLATFHSLRSH